MAWLKNTERTGMIQQWQLNLNLTYR